MLQRTCSERGIRFRINEVNSFYGGGKPGVSDTFASALWCLDFMFQVASCGGEGVNMETDINQMAWVSHYSPIFRDNAGQLMARPEYYGMLAFAMAGRGDMVKLTASSTDVNVSAYATKKGEGPLWVTVLNKELSRQVSVEIVLPGGCSKADAYRLAAPSMDSRDQVTLAGSQVLAGGTWSPGPAEKIAVIGQVASLRLPAASAVMVRLL
jgi:alpha-L-arabinofuranosidase